MIIPYKNKIVIEPTEAKGIIVTDQVSLQESGVVIAVGEGVTFTDVGDVIYFDSWGCSKTAADADGKRYYIVNEETIYGKEQRVQGQGMAPRLEDNTDVPAGGS